MNRALGISACLLFLLASLEVSVSTFCSGLGNDSAVYWSAGWAQVLGHKLYQEVICSYPPGVPVIMSALGSNVCNPFAAHSLLFLTHLANCAILFLIIRSMGLPRATTSFFVSIYITLVIHLDGLFVVLEPFQNLFILAAFLTYRKSWSLRSSLSTGCLVALSVMMKQFSVLYIPIFSYAAFTGSMQREPVEAKGPEAIKNLGLFLLGLLLPYVVYVLVAQQNFFKLLIHLATFGGSPYYKGQGASNYASLGMDSHTGLISRTLEILTRLFQPTYMLIPGFIFLVVLIRIRKVRLSYFLSSLFLVSLIPMSLRGFLHYAQLAAPWQILMAALIFTELGHEKLRQKALLTLFLLASVSPFVYINLKTARAEWKAPSLTPQLAMANFIHELVPDGKTISLEALGYLYPLAQRNPPGWDFESAFYDVTQSKADFIAVYSPGLDSDTNEQKEMNRVLASGNFAHIRTERYDDKAFRVGRVLFFRRL